MIRLLRLVSHALLIFVVLWSLQVLAALVVLPVLAFVLALLFHGWFGVSAVVISSSMHRLDVVTLLVLILTLLVSFPVGSFSDVVLIVTPFVLGVPLGRCLRLVVGAFVDRRTDESNESISASIRGADGSPSRVLLGARPGFPHDGDRLVGPGGDERPYGDRGADGQGRPAAERERGALRDVPRPDREPAVLPAVRVRPVRPGRPSRTS